MAREAIVDEDEFYSYVAFTFLEGMMFPQFHSSFKKHIVHSPKSVLEKGNLTSKVTRLITALRTNKIHNRAALVKKWENVNPYFLLE